ncbi:MAG: NTPase [Deltaproteobacteria bacterium]|nr:NTPase [Candidatus Zymogenaceae bacterium]
MQEKRHIFITGLPGVGKTTLIRSITDVLTGKKTGFFTREDRSGGRRIGFTIVTLDGNETPLARKSPAGAHRMGAYQVFVDNLEKLAIPAIKAEADIIVIDEIGKMECMSEPFKRAVLNALDGDTRVVATVAKKGVGFIKDVKHRRDVSLFEVTVKNRDAMTIMLRKKLIDAENPVSEGERGSVR